MVDRHFQVQADLRVHMDLDSAPRCTLRGVVCPVANSEIFLRLVSLEFQFYFKPGMQLILFICQRNYCSDSFEFPHFACIDSCKLFHGICGLMYNGTGLHVKPKDNLKPVLVDSFEAFIIGS